MQYTLITLLGNDQKLKNQIYQSYSGEIIEEDYIPIPYSNEVTNTQKQHNANKYYMLNTPSTIKKDELLSMWKNMKSISKLGKYKNYVIVYCFTDTQNDICQLLNDLHTQIGLPTNQQDILVLAKHQTLIDSINSQQSKNNNYSSYNYNTCTIILIDQQQSQNTIIKPKKNPFQTQPNFNSNIEKENNLKEIADETCNIILQEWNQIIKKSNNQADFIKNILKKQLISQIIQQLKLESKSQVEIFNLVVNIRQILEERKKSFIDSYQLIDLQRSSFRYCDNQNCEWLFNEKNQQNLDYVFQIKLYLDRTSTSQNQCLECKQKTFYLSFYTIKIEVFTEIQYLIINDIIQTYQQQSDQQEILQIMMLSNEEEQKTKIFNMVEENHSKYNPKRYNQFFKSQIINNKYRFHNSPPFDFTQESDNRITSFKQYFCKNEIDFFFIIIEFERTDIMKQRITNIIKKIHRLDRQRMALIVNQFKGEEEQKVELETSLKIFGFKTIQYISNQSPSDICNIMLQTLQNVEKKPFDFTDTIFEQEKDQSAQEQLKEDLIKISKQIDEDSKNNFKRQLAQNKEYLEKLEQEIGMLEETLYQKRMQKGELEYQCKQDQYKLNYWEKQTRK